MEKNPDRALVALFGETRPLEEGAEEGERSTVDLISEAQMYYDVMSHFHRLFHIQQRFPCCMRDPRQQLLRFESNLLPHRGPRDHPDLRVRRHCGRLMKCQPHRPRTEVWGIRVARRSWDRMSVGGCGVGVDMFGGRAGQASGMDAGSRRNGLVMVIGIPECCSRWEQYPGGRGAKIPQIVYAVSSDRSLGRDETGTKKHPRERQSGALLFYAVDLYFAIFAVLTLSSITVLKSFSFVLV
jgi:hypothetical protein